MHDLAAAFTLAARLMSHFDSALVEIVLMSLKVSLTAVVLASVIGLPAGACLALLEFPGRKFLIVLVNALMGLPPVVVGLTVYLLLSRSGLFGNYGLLFSPPAMIIAQCILVTPIITALGRQVIEDLWTEYAEQLRSLGAGVIRSVFTLIREGRYSLLTVVLAGFGRAIAEVGAVLIVGGNIAHSTRVMTTAIALETSKGDLALALALGIILITMALFINAAAYFTRDVAERFAG